MYASERHDDMEFSATHVDASYVPYYSEEKTRNETRLAKGEPLTPLPRLHWIRVKRPDGRSVGQGDEAMVNFRMLGYRAMGQDDLEALQKALGADALELPPSAHVDQNGLISRGDLALFFVGADRANLNRRNLKNLNEQMEQVSQTKGPVYRDTAREATYKGSLEELQSIEIPED
jgi:hypothetical protein